MRCCFWAQRRERSPAGSPTVVVADEIEPTQLTLRGTTLVWVDYGGPDGEDVVMQLPEGGAPTRVPTPRLIGLYGVTLGPTGVYWTTSNGSVFGLAF